MPSWQLAKSLVTLRDQVNTLRPKRSKVSDGTIGNAEHSSRTSDHNPNEDGVVCALDLTHDPKNGFDSYAFAEMLRAGKDSRVKYIISNYKICNGSRGKQPWQWRPYKVPPNKNPHAHHIHISVEGDVNSTKPWVLKPGAMPDPAPAMPAAPKLLRKGSKGEEVRRLQRLLGIKADGVFGQATHDAVAAFQRKEKLTPDGVVGPLTVDRLRLR